MVQTRCGHPLRQQQERLSAAYADLSRQLSFVTVLHTRMTHSMPHGAQNLWSYIAQMHVGPGTHEGVFHTRNHGKDQRSQALAVRLRLHRNSKYFD